MKFAAYDEMLKYLGSVVEYGDLTAFDFEEVPPQNKTKPPTIETKPCQIQPN